MALSWVLDKPFITAPLVGASKEKYVEEAIKAMDIHLTKEETKYLEEPYVPHKQYGFR